MNPATKPTREQVQSLIAGITYTRLPSGTSIVCEITLRNLHTVHGIASVVDMENYDESLGCGVAHTRAMEKVFEIASYDLHCRMDDTDMDNIRPLDNKHRTLTEAYKVENPVAVHFVQKLNSMPARAVIHITAGSADWVPTQQELDQLVEKFKESSLRDSADFVATRDGVSANFLT